MDYMIQQLMIVMKKLLSMKEINILNKGKFPKRIVIHYPRYPKGLELRLTQSQGIICRKLQNFMRLINKFYRRLKIKKNKKEKMKKINNQIKINRKIQHLLNKFFNNKKYQNKFKI